MSADSLNWQQLDAKGLNFAILVARFNSAITEKVLAGAREAFTKAGAETTGIEQKTECGHAAIMRECSKFTDILGLRKIFRGNKGALRIPLRSFQYLRRPRCAAKLLCFQ